MEILHNILKIKCCKNHKMLKETFSTTHAPSSNLGKIHKKNLFFFFKRKTWRKKLRGLLRLYCFDCLLEATRASTHCDKVITHVSKMYPSIENKTIIVMEYRNFKVKSLNVDDDMTIVWFNYWKILKSSEYCIQRVLYRFGVCGWEDLLRIYVRDGVKLMWNGRRYLGEWFLGFQIDFWINCLGMFRWILLRIQWD